MDNRSRRISRAAGKRYVLALIMLLASGGTNATDNSAETTAGFPDDMTALTAGELQEMRGGFEYAGMIFDFAAQLRTYVDGRLALETLITYSGNGTAAQHRLQTSTPAAPTNTAGSSPAYNGNVQLLGPGQDQTPAQVNLPGIDLAGLKEAAGILINDRKGATLALHEATRERITSMVINQASGRDIRQEMNISVTVENFQQFRDTLRSSVLNSRLNATPH
jgi:hypothetical protein